MHLHWLRAGRSGDRIPVEARFSAPVQTGPRTHPASCTMGTGSFPMVKSHRGVTLTPHSLLVLWSRKVRGIHLLAIWAVRTVQSPNACTEVHFTLHAFTWKDWGKLQRNVRIFRAPAKIRIWSFLNTGPNIVTRFTVWEDNYVFFSQWVRGYCFVTWGTVQVAEGLCAVRRHSFAATDCHCSLAARQTTPV
jgi:hypothetical protein